MPADTLYAYVGTYTPNGGGIYLFRIDPATAAFTRLQLLDDIRNPTWLALNPARDRLYAVSEIENFQGAHTGALACYAIDPSSFALTHLRSVASGGALPTYVSVHPSGRFVFVAHYGSGSVAVFPVAADGTPGEMTDLRPSIGPHHRAHAIDEPSGQFALADHESAHVQMVAPDPSGTFVLADDAGLDLTLVWRFDAQNGRLMPAEAPVINAPSGAAPRHFVFHPNGRTFYNLYEQDAKVAVYDYDAGALRLRQLVSSLPARFAGSNLSAEILMTPDGRFLYVANRVHNALATFAVAADGALRLAGESWAHSDYPRSAAIDPGGRWLFSLNQRGDSITSFRIGAASGALQFSGRFEPVGSPACMLIVAPRPR